MRDSEEIKTAVRSFLAEHVLNGKTSSVPSDSTALISSRMIDSIIALKLVTYLEETFQIEFEAHEVDQENLDTIDKITAFVQSKLK